MKKITALKLTCATVFVAGLTVGCASSGYARYDGDSKDMYSSGRTDGDVYAAEGADRITVSALSSSPDTRADWVTKFPFDRNTRVIETYTFTAPEPGMEIAGNLNEPEFKTETPSGTVFVEAAGGVGDVRTGRVIQHSPNPVR
jgi:hypothetical protein